MQMSGGNIPTRGLYQNLGNPSWFHARKTNKVNKTSVLIGKQLTLETNTNKMDTTRGA